MCREPALTVKWSQNYQVYHGKAATTRSVKKQQKAIKLESNASSQLKRPYTKYHHNSRVQTAETLIMQGLKQVPTCYSMMMHEEKTLVHN